MDEAYLRGCRHLPSPLPCGLGDPILMMKIYVLLGKDSNVRSHAHNAEFLIYKMTSKEVRAIGKTNKGKYSLGVNHLRSAPDKTVFIVPGSP